MTDPPAGASPSSDRETLVGVLGGMGPAATADFYRKLIERTPARRDQEHLRVMIWADPTVPDRVGGIMGEGADPYPALLAGAQRLRRAGVDIAAMPCNSAHFYLARLADETQLQFVDMVAEATRRARRAGAAVVGVMGTRALLRTRLYQNRFDEVGLRGITPTSEEQDIVDRAIACVKRGDAAAARPLVEEAAAALGARGAEQVVLACTELPVAVGPEIARADTSMIDPTDLLACGVVRAAGLTPVSLGATPIPPDR